MTKPKALIPAILLVLCPGLLSATSYVLVGDANLADQATVIARVEILERSVGRTSGLIATDYIALVDRLVKGSVPGSKFQIRVPGGVSLEGGYALKLYGAPAFRVGEKALVFLSQNQDGSYRILHFMQGAFHGVVNRGDLVFTRDFGEAMPMTLAGQASRIGDGPGRHAERFEGWIEDRAIGVEREPDYFVQRPRAADHGYVAAFTALSDDLPLRWINFDDGGNVRWKRHRDGQPGLSGGGDREFKRARKAWKKQTKVGIRLKNGGKTSSTSGFVGADLQNTILFDDRNEVIGRDFDCDTGGIIAIGGANAVLEGRSFRDEFFFQIDEAEIIVNDGVACFFSGNRKTAEEVYTHELGHTLGLGHSCGDRRSPSCANSDELDQAQMRAFVHDDGRGALLNSDDIAGVKHLYEADFTQIPCDIAPGKGRFCRRCGPCGNGQGNCNNDSECGYNLRCREDRGAEVGLAPDVNICLPRGNRQ